MDYNMIKNQVNSVKPLEKIGNFYEKQLENIILLPTGRPDNLAGKIYTNIKSWFKPKRNGSSRMNTRAYQTSYKQIAKDTSCCTKTAKQKVLLLEELGLISRGSTDEKKYGRLHNNTLNIFVWKETPHFTLEEGLEKTPEDLAKISKLHGKKMTVKDGIILPETLEIKLPHPPGKKFPDHIDNTTLNTTLIDNNDYQNNQFLNSKNFSRDECVETKESKIETSEIAKPAVNGLAEEEIVYAENEVENYEYAEEPDYADVPVEILEEGLGYEEVESPNTNNNSVEFVEKPESLKKTQSITSHYQKTEETVGKDGKTYQAPYLSHFRFTDAILLEAIRRSQKKHYTPQKVWVIIGNILERKPDKLVYGGRQGVINYLVKAIDGEKDYEYEYKYPPTQEERAVSMAEIQAEKQKAIDAKYALLLQGKVQSLSGAGRYYG